MFGIPFFVDFHTFESFMISNYIEYINLNDIMIYYLLFQIIYICFYGIVFLFLYKIFIRMARWLFWN